MFEQAARQHSVCHCRVGGVSSDLSGAPAGMGIFFEQGYGSLGGACVGRGEGSF